MAIEDQAALRDLVVLYCRAVDRRDPELMRRVFHPDALLDFGACSGGRWIALSRDPLQ